jgi:ribosomal protein S27AE
MAKWNEKDTMIRTVSVKNHFCSCCGRDTADLSQYCPECGSYMENGVSSRVANGAVDYEGEWVDNHCTKCGITPIGDETWTDYGVTPPRFELFMRFCPHCGAKMKVGA